MYDKSGIPLKSWRAVTWNVTNRDLMISAPLIISFFFNHETDDWINCQVQIVPEDGWFGQPKYNIKIFLQQIPLLKECGTQISVLRGIGLLRSICPPCDFNFYQFYLFVFFFFGGGGRVVCFGLFFFCYISLVIKIVLFRPAKIYKKQNARYGYKRSRYGDKQFNAN